MILHQRMVSPPQILPQPLKAPALEHAPQAKRLKGLAAVLQHISNEEGAANLQPTLSPAEKIDKEIPVYFDLPVASSDTDPLVWWRMEHGSFPHLAQVARKYLCVCGTSVPSERVFSTAGHVCNDSKSRLLPENVNILIFLAKNMNKLCIIAICMFFCAHNNLIQ